VARDLGTLKWFSYRATVPLFVHEVAKICAGAAPDGLALWVRGPDRRLCMSAEAG